MLKVDIINISAVLFDALERYRLYFAQVRQDSLELRKLLAGDPGQTRTHALILRLSGNDIRTILADGGLGAGSRF